MNRIHHHLAGTFGALLLFGGGIGQIAPAPATARLELSATRLDFEGQRAGGMFYMPTNLTLSIQRPEGVHREPAYRAKPLYGELRLGDGPHARYILALDEPESGEAKIYLDRNRNGDLTDDGDGAWPVKEAGETGDHYRGTFVLRASWGAGSSETSHGSYGLNFYRTPGRSGLGYYRAAARVGHIEFMGTAYEVTLIENDNDALFDKTFDPAVSTPPTTKPVWLLLDGRQYDIRGTFVFNGVNCLAKASADGSVLTLSPTYEVITMPRPTERPVGLLENGKVAPDFEVVAFTGEKLRLSDFKDRIVILDFWATWCGPCIRSMPHLQRVYQEVKGQGVVVIAVNVNDDQKLFERWVEKNRSNYGFTFAYDPAGRESPSIAQRHYQVRGIPATFVIGKDGKIVGSVSGYQEGDTSLEKILATVGVETRSVAPLRRLNAQLGGL